MLFKSDNSVKFLYLLSHSIVIFFDICSVSLTFNLLQKGPSLTSQPFSGPSSQVNQVASSLLSATSDAITYLCPLPLLPPPSPPSRALLCLPHGHIPRICAPEALSHFS